MMGSQKPALVWNLLDVILIDFHSKTFALETFFLCFKHALEESWLLGTVINLLERIWRLLEPAAMRF